MPLPHGHVSDIDQMKSFLCYTITFPMAIMILARCLQQPLKDGSFSTRYRRVRKHVLRFFRKFLNRQR